MDPLSISSLALGGATSLASSVIGAIKSKEANQKANDLITQRQKSNKKWYEDAMGADYLNRPDTQAILKKQRELLDEHYNRARATNVVSGGTDEALAMQKASADKTLAETMSNIAGQSAAYKDAVERQYQAQDNALNQQQVAVAQNQSAQIAQAASQGVSAGLNLMGTAMKSDLAKKKA